MEKREIAEKILKTLELQPFADPFADFYNGKFENFLTGWYAPNVPKLTREDMLREIERLFNLK